MINFVRTKVKEINAFRIRGNANFLIISFSNFDIFYKY